jgi:hypothetical protein
MLPVEGLVSVDELANWLGIKNEKLNEKLEKAGIKTTDLSRNSRFRFVSLADLVKADLKINPYKKKETLGSFTKTVDGSAPDKEAKMTLQGMKERIRFESGNPDEDKRLKEELMDPNDCFGKRYEGSEACQNCTVLAEFNGRKEQLKLFCEAISPQQVEIKAA